MNSRLSPVWAAILSLVLAVPALAGQGIVTIYGVTSNGGSPPTYTCNVSSSAGITVGDHVMAKTTSAGATGVWLVTAKPSATSVTLQDSLTQETGTAFGAPLANVTNGLAYGTPESGTTMIPDGASWWAAAARRNYVVLAEAAPSGAALTRVDDTNVTLTLGGTPGTALLQATSLTLGWTGTLAVARGGTGGGDAATARTNLGLVIGTNVQAFDADLATFAGIAGTRGAVLFYGASGWTQLAPGTSGHAIMSNGAGADPTYQAIAAPNLDAVLEVGATSSIAGGFSIVAGGAAVLEGGPSVRITANDTGGYVEFQGDGASMTFGPDEGAMQVTTTLTLQTGTGVLLTGAGGFIEASELSDPAAPAANKGRLYFRDNGSGKTQFVVRFPTGAVQVIATEP